MRDDEKVDPMEAQFEAQRELGLLHRQHRCLSNDKKAYVTEKQNIIRRQKAAIEKLLREKKQLMTLCDVAGRMWNQFCDENNLNQLNTLLEKEKVVHEEFQKEKKLIEMADEEEKILEDKIIERRRLIKASPSLSQAHYIATQKHIRVMENRLDNFSKKFNSSMAGNQKLRKRIDDVILQKERFTTLYFHLEQKLSEVKQNIEKVSETAISNFHSRDEAQHRMASLRERGEREQAMFHSDIKDYMRAIEHDRKLQNFMSAKDKDRTTILKEELLSRELKKLGIHLDSLNLEAEKFEMIFDKIKEAAGIQDIDELVSSFIEKEDANFALFNYVNAMSTEVESLQDAISMLQNEIDSTEKEGMRSDVRRQAILKELEVKLKRTKGCYTNLDKEATAIRHVLEQAKKKIEKLFKVIKCDRTAISELLGGGTTIDDYNAMQYLGIIEQKCNELLQTKALHRLKVCGELDPKEAHVIEGLLQGAGPQETLQMLSIIPPKIDDEYDVLLQVSSDNKPLSMEEVQSLFNKIVQKQGGIFRSAATGGAKQGKKKNVVKISVDNNSRML